LTARTLLEAARAWLRAVDFFLNGFGGGAVSAIEMPGMGTGPGPWWVDGRDEAMTAVAILANKLTDLGTGEAPAEPKPPPKMAPINRTRGDEAAMMRSIEQREADAETIRQVQAGNAEAYRRLVLKYQQRVYGVSFGMVQNPEDAREITQDAFIKAYKSLDRFRFDASFYTWLYRITVNLAIDFKRRAVKRRTDELDETRQYKDESGMVMQSHTSSSPGKRLERKRLADTIQAAIDQLPEDQRTAILLREVEGLSYREIAESMDCAEGTVMSRLFYGRKKLQEILKDLRGKKETP
jgi:RNA polymerase sigma-70 factor, ECF subfamily